MRRSYTVCLLAALTTCFAAAALAVTPVGTAFTYQGSLQNSNVPANGQYDFQFKLFDDPTAGSQIGSTVTVSGLQVAAGIFTTTLDFGAGAFGPNARWLEIGVRATSGNPPPFTILSPRQPVTPDPVSQFSMSSADNHWSQVGSAITNNNTNGFVGINRTSRVSNAEYFGVLAPVNSGYGGMYIQTTGAAGQPFYGYATSSAFAWSYLDGPTGNWILTNNNFTALVATNTGKIGIGTTSPSTPLEVDAGSGDAITGSASGAFSNGVHGTGLAAGVRGDCSASDGAGVYGRDDTNGASGVEGTTSGNGSAGVAGYAFSGTGVYGQSTNGYAVYGSCPGGPGYAGYFNGDVHVNGTLSKNSGSFKIDHPLDPLNKTLSHSFVESPDMMNVYNGNVTTDADGRATVTLPAYFQALNQDFRYQLTTIGGFAQTTVEKEIQDNAFVIRTDRPNVRVSWQVTGIRHDPWANAHRIVVEQDKPLAQRGTYMNPSVYATSEKLPGVAGASNRAPR